MKPKVAVTVPWSLTNRNLAGEQVCVARLNGAGCSAYQGFLAGAALPKRDALNLARFW